MDENLEERIRELHEKAKDINDKMAINLLEGYSELLNLYKKELDKYKNNSNRLVDVEGYGKIVVNVRFDKLDYVDSPVIEVRNKQGENIFLEPTFKRYPSCTRWESNQLLPSGNYEVIVKYEDKNRKKDITIKPEQENTILFDLMNNRKMYVE